MLFRSTKSLVSGSAILAVAAVLGAVHDWTALFAIPVIFLTGLCFAAPGLIVTAYARAYEYFNFYMTLIMTPMFILCGVFYPVSTLPGPLQAVVQFLPLTHAIAVIRPLIVGAPVEDLFYHLGALALFGVLCAWIAAILIRRRLIQ